MNWAIIGSGNGLSPIRHQAITWTNDGLMPIGLLGTNVYEIWIGILNIFIQENALNMSSAKMAAILSKGEGDELRWISQGYPILQQPPAMNLMGYRDSMICYGGVLTRLSRCMMTSSNGNIFGVTGPLCREFTGHRWIPLTKASDAGLWCFLWSAPVQKVVHTIETPVIWDAIVLIMTSL